jgi:asparagine synthase (glutamine-hydrolysing)
MAEPAAIDVLGDFVFACGPQARAWVHRCGLAVAEDAMPVALATRGGIRRGEAAVPGDGTLRWFGVGDLVAGAFGEGIALHAGVPAQASWRGRFVQVVWQPQSARVVAFTDHFASLPLYALVREGTLLLASDLRLVLASGASRRAIDPLAIYHYLNFGCIPAPATLCSDVRRIEPGTRLSWTDGVLREERWFVPRYAEDLGGSEEALADELRTRIADDVAAYRPPGADWGCFLSGGTDSSSIVTLLARERPDRRVRTFSIGFAEAGYDELDFARAAAAACGADATTATLRRDEAEALLARVVDAYDQPFGNASAIPTLACAELAAANGMRVLLGGDGGDEIFGGNQRYAKDQVMEAFHRLPAPLRALGRGAGRLAGRSRAHVMQRIENFVERASLPNPDRFYTDDSFASDYYDELLTPAFRAAVARDASLERMRETYALGEPASPLHRIMRLDLLMAIAQNDLVKVHGACKAAGISARFPYVDPELVAWTGRLPQRFKVRGLDKRHLFKRAMRGVLPEAVLSKKKQGFGLPITVWLRSDAAFQARVREVLFDPRTQARGWFEGAFIERLLAEHIRGSWDHSAALCALMVLEQWLRRHLDAA